MWGYVLEVAPVQMVTKLLGYDRSLCGLLATDGRFRYLIPAALRVDDGRDARVLLWREVLQDPRGFLDYLLSNQQTNDYSIRSDGIVPITISLRIQSDSCLMAWSRFEPLSRTAHSQTTITRQPASRSCCVFSASRTTFFENFSAHHARLDAGIVANRQPLWRCQKHPFTKTTAL